MTFSTIIKWLLFNNTQKMKDVTYNATLKFFFREAETTSQHDVNVMTAHHWTSLLWFSSNCCMEPALMKLKTYNTLNSLHTTPPTNTPNNALTPQAQDFTQSLTPSSFPWHTAANKFEKCRLKKHKISGRATALSKKRN